MLVRLCRAGQLPAYYKMLRYPERRSTHVSLLIWDMFSCFMDMMSQDNVKIFQYYRNDGCHPIVEIEAHSQFSISSNHLPQAVLLAQLPP